MAECCAAWSPTRSTFRGTTARSEGPPTDRSAVPRFCMQQQTSQTWRQPPLLNGTRRTNESGFPSGAPATTTERTRRTNKNSSQPGRQRLPPNGTRRTNENGLQPRRLFPVRRDFEQGRAWPHDHFYLLFPDPKPHFVFGILSRYSFPPWQNTKTETHNQGSGKAGRAANPKRATQTANKPKTSPPERQTPAQPRGLRPFPPYACQAPKWASEPVLWTDWPPVDNPGR